MVTIVKRKVPHSDFIVAWCQHCERAVYSEEGVERRLLAKHLHFTYEGVLCLVCRKNRALWDMLAARAAQWMARVKERFP
jgi:hypothetical protein